MRDCLAAPFFKSENNEIVVLREVGKHRPTFGEGFGLVERHHWTPTDWNYEQVLQAYQATDECHLLLNDHLKASVGTMADTRYPWVRGECLPITTRKGESSQRFFYRGRRIFGSLEEAITYIICERESLGS